MTSLLNLGVQANALGAATKQAIGLAEALGLDSAAAAKYTALARQGEFTILQRYVTALREATTQAEKQAIVTDLMNKGWEQAQRNATTTSGALEQLGNAFGDLGETIGDLVSGDGMGGALIEIKLLVEDLDEAIKSLQGTAGGGGLKSFFADAADGLRVVSGFLGAVTAGSSVFEAADIATAQTLEARQDREDRRRHRYDHQSEGRRRHLRLRRGGPEGIDGCRRGRDAAATRRDGLHDRRQRRFVRSRAAAVHRSLRRLRDGRAFHVAGQAHPGHLRRPYEAGSGLSSDLPDSSPASGP